MVVRKRDDNIYFVIPSLEVHPCSYKDNKDQCQMKNKVIQGEDRRGNYGLAVTDGSFQAGNAAADQAIAAAGILTASALTIATGNPLVGAAFTIVFSAVLGGGAEQSAPLCGGANAHSDAIGDCLFGYIANHIADAFSGERIRVKI